MNSLQGCRAAMTHLPIANASTDVVATTSLVLALMNVCGPSKACQTVAVTTSRAQMSASTALRATNNMSLDTMQACVTLHRSMPGLRSRETNSELIAICT